MIHLQAIPVPTSPHGWCLIPLLDLPPYSNLIILHCMKNYLGNEQFVMINLIRKNTVVSTTQVVITGHVHYYWSCAHPSELCERFSKYQYFWCGTGMDPDTRADVSRSTADVRWMEGRACCICRSL